MADVFSPEERSRHMAKIRGGDTQPELILRKLLWRSGLRYTLRNRGLPGRPDIVLPRWRTVVFVHGCFWHAHEHCRYFKVPSTKVEFWKAKLAANIERDQRVVGACRERGWVALTVWECAIRADAEAVARLVGQLVKVPPPTGEAQVREARDSRGKLEVTEEGPRVRAI